MILDLVNMVNNVTPAMWEDRPKSKKKPAVPLLEDDKDGVATVTYLTRVKRVASLISGKEPRSLGLHPVVYFYGASGRFQAIAFLATVRFVKELEERDQLKKFTKVRRDFEEFLISHKHYVSAVGHAYGGRTRSLEPLVAMYRTIFEELVKGSGTEAVEARLLKDTTSAALKAAAQQDEPKQRRKFTADDRSESFLRQALEAPNRCNICGARLHVKGITTDHVKRKQDGGTGGAENAQPAHPYCNSGFKESLHAAASRDPVT